MRIFSNIPSAGGASKDFGIIQPPNGTSPTAAIEHDTLNLTSTDGSVVITGNSGTNTVNMSSYGTNHQTNIVYVSKGGDDTNGTGTYLNPYLTITKAETSITTASISNPFVIKVSPGAYSEGNLTLKPYVDIVGDNIPSAIGNYTGNTSINVTSFVTGTAWDELVNIVNMGFQNVEITGTPSIDLSARTPDDMTMNFENVVISSDFSFFGPDNPTTGVAEFSFQNVRCSGIITLKSLNANFLSAEITLITLLTTANAFTTATLIGCRVTDTLTITTTGGNNSATGVLLSSYCSNIVVTNGDGGSGIDATSDSLPPLSHITLTGSPFVSYFNDATGLAYVPTTSGDWTSTPVTVQGGLDQLAHNQTIGMRYFSAPSGVSSALVTIVYGTKDYESAANYTSGIWLCPVAGRYHISAQLLIAATFAAGNASVLEIQVGGTVKSRNTVDAGGVQGQVSLQCTDILSLAAGATLRIQAKSAATAPSVVSSNFDNFLSISRLGT